MTGPFEPSSRDPTRPVPAPGPPPGPDAPAWDRNPAPSSGPPGAAAGRNDTLVRIGAALSALAALIGVWFFDHERSYARSHPYASDLAEVLQWVGVALVALGTAGVLFAVAHLRSRR